MVADRNDAESVREALSGRRFDVVFDNVYDWERGTTAAQVEATVRACGDRLSRYIFMSSVAAYGDGLNHKESDPLAPDYHADPYVRHKATTERLLFRMHAQTGLAGGDFPAAVRLRTQQSVLPRAVLLGPPARRPPDHHPRRRPPADAVRLRQGPGAAMVRAMEEPRAVGEAFNIGDLKPLTQVELVERLARAANTEATLARVPRDLIQQAGGNAMEEPYYFGEYLDLCRPSR
jgi:2'-hydroxyisoflavone reductase